MPSLNQPVPGRRRVSIDGTVVRGSKKSSLRSRLTRRPKVLIGSLIAPVVTAVVIATGMASASACEPLIEAGANCDGTVTFTARAWDGDGATDELRTNKNVEIQYSINGVDGPFEKVKSSGSKYEFTKANGFLFSDKFTLPSNLKRPIPVTIRAVAIAKWGTNSDLDEANKSSKTTIRLADCAEPTAVVTAPTCDSKDAVVTLSNSSTEPVQFKVSRDGTVVDSPTVTNGSVKRSIAVTSTTKVTVEAPGMKAVTKDISPVTNCESIPNVPDEKPALKAALAKTCTSGVPGVAVTLDNAANTKAALFDVAVDGEVFDTVSVSVGKVEVVAYSFEDLELGVGDIGVVSVLADKKTLISDEVVNDCVDSYAEISAECDTPAGSGAVLKFQNTGQVPDTFTVVRDGEVVAGSPFTLEPSDKVTQKLLKLNDGEVASIAIVSENGVNVQEDVTVDCGGQPVEDEEVAEVKAKTISRAHLANTGYEMWPEVALGSLFLLLGVVTLRLRRFV